MPKTTSHLYTRREVHFEVEGCGLFEARASALHLRKIECSEEWASDT